MHRVFRVRPLVDGEGKELGYPEFLTRNQQYFLDDNHMIAVDDEEDADAFQMDHDEVALVDSVPAPKDTEATHKRVLESQVGTKSKGDK